MISKRIFSTILSALVVTCSISNYNTYEKTRTLAAEAEDTSVNTGTCGDSATYSLDDAGNLTISGNGAISDYVAGENLFANSAPIKKVIIEEGITHIGNYAFSSCHDIQSIELPESLTGIGEYVFENCTSLTSIIIPDSVTSIGQYAFSGTAVKSVVIPESVVTLDTNSLFMGCKKLESVVLPQSVTAIYSNAFKECVMLKEVDIPDSVTAIQNDAFSGTTFTSLFIPSGVTMINGNALRGSKIDTIYGFKDSAAETFAKKNGLDFIESEERAWKRTDILPVAGVYKLECDVDVKSYITISGMLDLDLNGHTVKIPEIICNSTSNVIIRDSDQQKKGTIICTADSNLITSYNKLTIYGGNFYGYDKKTVCATVRINDGSFDYYGGEIIGYYSHALSLRTKDGIINIMGGRLKASSAENGKINVYSVWLADTFAGTLNISDGEMHSDIGAAVSGSPSDCIVNISGGKIISDKDYGLKCLKNGTVNLSGNICIKGDKGGIYVPNGKSVNITGAITGADVSVYAEAAGIITNGLGKYISDSTLKRYLPYIKANGTISVNDDGELIIDVPDVTSTTSVSGSATSTTTTTSLTSTSTTTTNSTTTTTKETTATTTTTTTSTSNNTNSTTKNTSTTTAIGSTTTATSTITNTTQPTTTLVTTVTTTTPYLHTSFWLYNQTIKVGEYAQYYTDGWPLDHIESSDTSIAIIENGKIKGVAPGVVKITFYSDKNAYNDDTLNVVALEYALGDVDGNKTINAVDASYVLEDYARTSTGKSSNFNDAQKKAADVNNDKNNNAVDASYILSYYAYASTTKEKPLSLEEFMKKN
ncbi:MAG: leucine-rich repeat protein [Prevotella sp.]|nr:leucine-rich repeat protein [Prevotella sp.]